MYLLICNCCSSVIAVTVMMEGLLRFQIHPQLLLCVGTTLLKAAWPSSKLCLSSNFAPCKANKLKEVYIDKTKKLDKMKAHHKSLSRAADRDRLPVKLRVQLLVMLHVCTQAQYLYTLPLLTLVPVRR